MTEIQQRAMSREDAERTATDFVTDFLAGAIEQAKSLAAMSDAEMFHGLDQKTVEYLRERIAENPEIKTTLRKAARLRAAQAARPNRVSARYVYFIEASQSGLIKIGSASDPRGRLATLQTGSPEALRLIGYIDGGEQEERRLHRQFARSRSHGEWFHPSVDLAKYIDTMEGMHV